MVLISSNFPKKELIFDSDRTITSKRHTLNIFLFIELVFKYYEVVTILVPRLF